MMNHTGTVLLETDRLRLRRGTMDDAEDMFRNWCSDTEVTHFLTWPTHRSIGVTQRVLEDWIARYTQDTFYQWFMEVKTTGAAIGTITVVAIDEPLARAHIGYCVGRPWWGQGLVTEAFQAVIRHLFEKVGFNRIDAKHDARNIGSGRVMEKSGLQYEGCSRQSVLSNAGIGDAKHYAILREDYR